MILYHSVLSRVARDHHWFDNDCFEAKRRTRRLERAYRAACRRQTAQRNTGSSTGVDNAKAALSFGGVNDAAIVTFARFVWRSAFWRDTVERDRESPRKLWRSVNQLLGCGRPPASSCITVDESSRFFFRESQRRQTQY